MKVDLTKEEIAEIKYCLSLRRNLIETGDPFLSAEDVDNQGGEATVQPTNGKVHIKPLSRSQRELLAFYDQLEDKLS